MKRLRAYAISSAALSRERYILMSSASSIPGILSLIVFLLCPIAMERLMTVCIVTSFLGLISPAPDHMDVLLLLRNVPKGATIQATGSGLAWYL